MVEFLLWLSDVGKVKVCPAIGRRILTVNFYR